MYSAFTILCVDDDNDDLFFITATIQKAYPSFHTPVATNGVKAMQYLEAAKVKGELPALILLDINMPLLNGKQTLAKIKADPELSTIPIVVFSTSNLPSDRLYCTHYKVEMVTKPHSLSELELVLQRVLHHILNH